MKHILLRQLLSPKSHYISLQIKEIFKKLFPALEAVLLASFLKVSISDLVPAVHARGDNLPITSKSLSLT